MIFDFACTNALAHNSNQFETLLDFNSNRDVWTESAYRSEEKEAILDTMNYRSHTHEKRNSAATPSKKQNARIKTR